MENQENTQVQGTSTAPEKLHGAIGALITGIISIAVSWGWIFGSICGLVLAIIALSLAGKATKLYNQNPSGYSNFGVARAGKICGIIGLISSIIGLIFWIIFTAFVGFAAFSAFH